MSSIFGRFNTDHQPVEAHDLQRMQTELNHWQPDTTGTWLQGPVALGHLMLYNTPESKNEQLPLYNSIYNLSITADARLDNRVDIYTILSIDKAQGASMPDSNIILLLYAKYGATCVKYMIGDFAFAIWDGNEQQLFCARDQMGVKPFFYYHHHNYFAFATEKKGLLAIPDIDKTIDEQFLYNQMIFTPQQAADTTLYKHIKRLPPAHSMLVKRSAGLKFINYWTLNADTELKFKHKQDYYDGLLHHFDEAVKCRTRSDYIVGAELSGGLDSTAITSAAHQFLKMHGKQLTTFSNILPPGVTDKNLLINDELAYIEEVLKFNGISNFVYITGKDDNDETDDEEFSIIVNDGLEAWNPLWQLPSKKVALGMGVRTMLSGFPGDQMVTTKANSRYLNLLDKKQYLKYLKYTVKNKFALKTLLPFVPGQINSFLRKIKLSTGNYNIYLKQASNIFNIPEHYKKSSSDYLWESNLVKQRFKSYRHYQKYELLHPLVSQRMESETRFGIYFKTEPRFPLADIRLTQYFLSMPNELKFEGPIPRMAFRKAAAKYLPPLIQNRNDKSMAVAPFTMLKKYDEVPGIELIINQMPDNPLINKKELLKTIALRKTISFEDSFKEINTILSNPLPKKELLLWLYKNFPKQY